MKLQKPSNDSTYQTQSKTKQDSSKQLPQEKQQNVKFKQLKMNRQLKLILKANDTQNVEKHTQEPKMIHQHHKNHHQVATKEQSNRSTTRETQKQSANANQNHQSTHQAQFKTNIQ